MDTATEFKTIRGRVTALLADDERCRNDDKYLTYRVFEDISRENGEGIFISFKLWSAFPAFETIKRVRAQIQNDEGRFLPTDERVAAKRKKWEREVPTALGYPEAGQ